MRVLIGLIVIVVLLVAGDAWVRSYVERQVEERLQDELGIATAPTIELGGFPFTIRLLSQKFPTAEIDADELRRRGLVLRDLHIEMRNVELSWTDKSATVERGEGSALVTAAALRDLITRRTDLGSVSIDAGGVAARIPGVGRVRRIPLALDNGDLVLRLPRVPDISVSLPRPLTGLEYRSLEITGDGVRLSFTLNDSILR